MNSFEYISTETEQLELERRDTQTISQETETLPVTVPASAPAPKADTETELVADQPKPIETFEMESIPQVSTELTYSCLLIPRFSDHYLAGDITRDVEAWVKEICISYGWRLESIAVRPGYLQWVMAVPFTENPARFMKLTRQITSQKIFEDYPRFKRKNVAIDFWAPGFSVAPGNAPHSAEDVNNFILQTRRQQGII